MKIVRPDGGEFEKEQILVGWRKTDEQMEPETAPPTHFGRQYNDNRYSVSEHGCRALECRGTYGVPPGQ
jgi:hypothetical protein